MSLSQASLHFDYIIIDHFSLFPFKFTLTVFLWLTVSVCVLQARHVSWTFKGYEINTNNNPDYSIIEEPLPDGIKSILIIRESQSKHFGQYNCTVVNEHGNDVMEIELLRQGT